MALTLKYAISATQTTIDVDGSDTLVEGDIRQIDSEQILIRVAVPATLAYGESAYQRLTVYRGVEGTGKAAHAAEAELTTPASGGTTPTLAEVLAAGNDPGGQAIAGTSVEVDGGDAYLLLEDDATLSSGAGTGGAVALFASGEAQLHGGDRTGQPSGNGGNVALIGGTAGTDGNGGDLTWQGGAGNGAGRNGLVFLNLPTADPEVAGALWSDGGIVTVSAG